MLTIGNIPLGVETVIVVIAAFAGTVALWWCCFQRAERIGKDAIDGNGDAFEVPVATAVLIFGGPAIFLLARLAFIHQATGVIAASLVLLGVAIADTQAEKPSTATL